MSNCFQKSEGIYSSSGSSLPKQRKGSYEDEDLDKISFDLNGEDISKKMTANVNVSVEMQKSMITCVWHHHMGKR